MKTVAEHLVEALVAAGVRRIYGVVGDSLNSIVDAVHHNKRIEWVHVRHEEAGAFAASAEAQLTGNLAVCAGSCGPGNLHLINGLFDAHKTLTLVGASPERCQNGRVIKFGISHIPATKLRCAKNLSVPAFIGIQAK